MEQKPTFERIGVLPDGSIHWIAFFQGKTYELVLSKEIEREDLQERVLLLALRKVINPPQSLTVG